MFKQIIFGLLCALLSFGNTYAKALQSTQLVRPLQIQIPATEKVSPYSPWLRPIAT